MKSFRPMLVLAASVLLLSGCAAVQQLIQKPTVSLKNVKLQEASLFDATMVFEFDVSNPNPIGGTISALSYDFDVDQKNFLEGVLDKGISLPASGSSTVELPIKIQYLDFIGSVLEFTRKDNVPYNLQGSFRVFGFDIPYSKSGEITIPDLPKVALKTVDIQDLSLTGGSLVFQLELDNNNPFAVDLGALDYNIKLGGTEFADGISRSINSISENGASTVEIPLNVNFLQLGQAAYSLLNGSSSSYEVAGNMKFNVPGMGEQSFPFSRTGDVPID